MRRVENAFPILTINNYCARRRFGSGVAVIRCGENGKVA